MKVIFSNITNNTFARSAALGLAKAGMLEEYYTSMAVFEGDFWDRLSHTTGLSEIQRRRFNPILEPHVNAKPWREIGRQIAIKTKLAPLIKHETGYLNVDAVSRGLDKRVAKNLKKVVSKGVKGVYSYEDMAVYSFKEAKKLGLSCLYDLPIGYWREAHRFLKIEQEAWPEWSPTLTGFSDSEKKLARKDEELKLADAIFVASSFTAKSLDAYPGKLGPIHIVPYGFPPVNENKRSYYQPDGKSKLKLLFVGGLSQRKGIANLFEAVESLENLVELTIVGYKASENCKPLNAGLEKHNWIPTMPHDKVLNLMRENDVLVFPSLFEGFGLVMTEAMSQGTPVITTDRTAGPDIMTHGKDGWFVEAGSTAALKQQIEELLQSPKMIKEASKAAIETAKSWTWDDYGRKLTGIIRKTIDY